jgi:hypothetical protein
LILCCFFWQKNKAIEEELANAQNLQVLFDIFIDAFM